MSVAPAAGPERPVFMPTRTMASEFFELPTDAHKSGRLIGVDSASSMGGDQSGMRIIGQGFWVRT
jgi:hypothetical protein